jgi:hypothetical protein
MHPYHLLHNFGLLRIEKILFSIPPKYKGRIEHGSERIKISQNIYSIHNHPSNTYTLSISIL